MSLYIHTHTHTQVCGLNGKSLVYHQSSSNNDERLTTTTTNHETSKSPLSIHRAHTLTSYTYTCILKYMLYTYMYMYMV